MPMFQVDGGRPVPARPVRPADAAYGASVVDEHLGALLGEHLLPVRVRSGAEDEPYLLAVDVHGRPVVVEVVGLLDGPTLLRALAHLGRAARPSMRDLAASYHGGVQRFSADLATFRESVPAVRLAPTGGLSRLLVVCATIGAGMIDVVQALDARGIDVLRVGVVDGPGGQLIDVSPVHLSAPDGSWSVSGGVATLAAHGSLHDAGVGEPPDEDTVSQLPPRHMVTRVPSGIRLGAAVPTTAPHASSAAPHQPSAAPPPAAPHRVAPGPVVPEPAPNGVAPERVALDRVVPDGVATGSPADQDPYQRALAATRAVPFQAPPADATPPDGVPAWSPVRPIVDGPAPAAAPDASPAEGPAVPQGRPARDRLAALAADGPMVLVWHRHRRGTFHEALVHPGGQIELADGTRVADPSAAAEIAAGSSVPVDGWRVWRVGSAE
ncbi:MAG TPA: hypothetical protein PKB06_10890, partial [Actinotalea sp.]|nr:hypothetical protein [Actinotalea sp.]